MSSYATPTDLTAFGISAAALTGFPPEQQQAALDAASDVADGFLRSRFQLPVVSATSDLKRAVCAIAAFDLLTTRGFNPESGSDAAITKRYDDAMQWLKDVAKGIVTPALTDSTPGGESPRAPLVITAPSREW